MGTQMDTLRGAFPGQDSSDDEAFDLDHNEDEPVRETPPAAIGQDERRMQVRAYNFWASLLDNRNFPSIEDLEPESLPDFGPYSVLLDFSTGIENPAIQFLGGELATECGAEGPIQHLADVPSRSLLSRITDHYLQIIANQAPIGFEAEFVNQRGATILYRGILLPFSSDDDTIDFIYGVINWKEYANQQTADALLLEIDQALDVTPKPEPVEQPLAEWADGPTDAEEVSELTPLAAAARVDDEDWPVPGFAHDASAAWDGEGPKPADGIELAEDGVTAWAAAPDWDDEDGEELELSADMVLPETDKAPVSAAPIAPAPVASEPVDFAEPDWADAASPDDMGLADWLASARELAMSAAVTEDRSRQALYAAIGRAYDFSLAAAEAPEELAELIADAGLAVQDRAPLTPVVKLVFGADYDKTRIAEYASALGHAQRTGLARGTMAEYLGSVPGGLKALVAEERRLRRGDLAPAPARDAPRPGILRKLRQLDYCPIAEVPAEGSEFALLVARRLPSGEVVLVGEVTGDAALFEKAARKLLV